MRAASSAPPIGVISSACTFRPKPAERPASRISRVSSTPKTPFSQKTSMNSASFCRATAGIISSMTTRSVRLRIVEFGRLLMRAHEGRHDVERSLAPEAGDDAEHLELGLELEPVTALDLDGRRPTLEHLGEPPAAHLEETLFVHFPHLADRSPDPAPAALDLEVALPADARLVLVRAIARKHGVRMRIDPARQHDAPGCIDRPRDPCPADPFFDLGAGAREEDDSPGNRNRPVGNDAGIG